MKYRLWIAASMFACVIYAQSPRPRDKADDTRKDKAGAATNSHASDPITQINTTVQEAGPKNDSHNTYEWFWPPIWSSWAAVIAACVAAWAAFRTLKAINRQTKVLVNQTRIFSRQASANKQAADAAKASADTAAKAADVAEKTLLLTERADVLMKKVDPNSSGQQLRTDTVVTLWIKNYGRTRANSVFVNVVLGLHPVAPADFNRDQVRVVIASGETIKREFPALRDCVPGSVQAILNGDVVLAFGGWISYIDVFGKEHVTHCEGRYHLALGAFVITLNEAD
jgi:hypothetical protein